MNDVCEGLDAVLSHFGSAHVIHARLNVAKAELPTTAWYVLRHTILSWIFPTTLGFCGRLNPRRWLVDARNANVVKPKKIHPPASSDVVEYIGWSRWPLLDATRSRSAMSRCRLLESSTLDLTHRKVRPCQSYSSVRRLTKARPEDCPSNTRRIGDNEP